MRIVREWWRGADGRAYPVESGRGVFPECHVHDLPVLVTWAHANPPPTAKDHEDMLGMFRAAVGPAVFSS